MRARESVARWFLMAVIVFLPFAVGWFLPRHFLGESIWDFVPQLNDECAYASMARGFSAAGWDSGYYVVNELPAPLRLSRFGPHGPVFPVMLGAWCRVFGTEAGRWLSFNLLVLGAALALFVAVVRMGVARLALFAAFIGTFWPLHFNAAFLMQDALHLAFGLVLACGFHRLLLDGAESPLALRAGVVAAVSCFAVIRPSWTVLLLPAVLLGQRRRGPWQVVRALAAAGLATAGVLAAWKVLASPWPASVPGFRFQETFDGRYGFGAMLEFSLGNLRALVSSCAPNCRSWEALWLLNRKQWLVIWGACLCFVAWPFLAPRLKARVPPAGWLPPAEESLFHFYNIAAIVAAICLVGMVHEQADYRASAPHMLLSAALLLSSRSRLSLALGVLLIACNATGARDFWRFAPEQRIHYVQDAGRRIDGFREAVRPFVSFQEGADPWCNTMLSCNRPWSFLDLLGLPAGIGVTALFNWEGTAQPVKSRYILLDVERFPETNEFPGPITSEPGRGGGMRIRFGKAGAIHVRRLTGTPVGTLYLNLDARCP